MKSEKFQYWVFDNDGGFFITVYAETDKDFETWNEKAEKPGLKTLSLMVFTNNPNTTYSKAANYQEANQKAQLEPFNRSIRGQKNILDIIFTHEAGQSRMTLSLADSPNIFLEKGFFENRLVWMWSVANSLRGMNAEMKPVPKLFKISCVVVEPSQTMPDWFNEWDGKFYYPAEHLD